MGAVLITLFKVNLSLLLSQISGNRSGKHELVGERLAESTVNASQISEPNKLLLDIMAVQRKSMGLRLLHDGYAISMHLIEPSLQITSRAVHIERAGATKPPPTSTLLVGINGGRSMSRISGSLPSTSHSRTPR